MDEEIKNLLEKEIKDEIQNISALESGSHEKSSAINDLATLYKLRIEETRTDWDVDEKYNRRIMDNEQRQSEAASREREERLREGQLVEQVKDRYFRFGVEAAGIILPLIFYAAWMKRGFKFEETGTYTSTTFRGLFGRFRPARK
jgi:hypothetical protein